jgi:hypothetical protein
MPRKKPYTALGILRTRCSFRGCKKPGRHQWQCCALGNLYMPLCTEHDIGLNNVAAKYILGAEKSKSIIRRYSRTQLVARVRRTPRQRRGDKNKLIPLDKPGK